MKRNKTLKKSAGPYTAHAMASGRRGTKSATKYRLQWRARDIISVGHMSRHFMNRTTSLASFRQWNAAADCWESMRPPNGRIIRACLIQIEIERKQDQDSRSFA
jgi:hypothetical protein